MIRSRTSLIPVAVLAAWPGSARADRDTVEPVADQPGEPFDRGTELRLTGAELAARGAVDLATALALLPDVALRDDGRGGLAVELRGARGGAVSVMIDGVVVVDPYHGGFDVSTIPITDIDQIRVALSPQSPIDGPGGPGGVIDVRTRDALGPQLVIARLTTDSLLRLGATGTARVGLARQLALRLSGSGVGGARELEVPGAAIREGRHTVTGAGRLEYRDGDRRIAVDGFVDDRHYVAPPSDTMGGTILVVDRETTARASATADDKLGPVELQAIAWTQYLRRQSRFFFDPALATQLQVENLQALRSGARALATGPWLDQLRWTASASVDFEKAVVSNVTNQAVRGDATVVEAAGGLVFERAALRADASAGVAAPFGVHARPWPEASAAIRYRFSALELAASGAYKARVPTLQERFDATHGTINLRPERTAYAELRAIQRLGDRVRLELAPYLRRLAGVIRQSPLPTDRSKLINFDTELFAGVDAEARVTASRMIEAGAAYAYIRGTSSYTGEDPIDRLAHHRWDAWATGRAGTRVSGLARLTYVGASLDQGRPVSGYALISASLTGQLTTQYLAVVRVDDLLNARPEIRTGYHTAGRVISVVLQGAWD